MKHYRCHMIWVNNTNVVQIGNTVFFKDKYLKIPIVAAADSLRNTAENLTKALDGSIPQSTTGRETIDWFMKLFKENTIRYQEEGVAWQMVLKERASRQRKHEELRQNNEKARLNAKSASKQQASQGSPTMKKPPKKSPNEEMSRKEKRTHRGKMKKPPLETLNPREQPDQSRKKQLWAYRASHAPQWSSQLEIQYLGVSLYSFSVDKQMQCWMESWASYWNIGILFSNQNVKMCEANHSATKSED